MRFTQRMLDALVQAGGYRIPPGVSVRFEDSRLLPHPDLADLADCVRTQLERQAVPGSGTPNAPRPPKSHPDCEAARCGVHECSGARRGGPCYVSATAWIRGRRYGPGDSLT